MTDIFLMMGGTVARYLQSTILATNDLLFCHHGGHGRKMDLYPYPYTFSHVLEDRAIIIITLGKVRWLAWRCCAALLDLLRDNGKQTLDRELSSLRCLVKECSYSTHYGSGQ